jgi:hypothetical protein
MCVRRDAQNVVAELDATLAHRRILGQDPGTLAAAARDLRNRMDGIGVGADEVVPSTMNTLP